MQIVYCNETGRDILIHPATYAYGCTANKDVIKHLDRCVFEIPDGATPQIEMCDVKDGGLSILVTPIIFYKNEKATRANNELL